MPLSLAKTQAVAKLAEHLVDYLPGKPHPFADQSISFPGIAARLGIGSYWMAGSKMSSVTGLLERTLERDSKRYCTLVLEVVKRGIVYRQRKKPITRQDIECLDQLVVRTGFRIKEMSDPTFLSSLPSVDAPTHSGRDSGSSARASEPLPSKMQLTGFKNRLLALAELAPVNRALNSRGSWVNYLRRSALLRELRFAWLVNR